MQIYTYTPKEWSKKKEVQHLDRKPNLPKVKRTLVTVAPLTVMMVTAVSEPTNGPRTSQELLAASSRKAVKSTVSLQPTDKLKELTQSCAAEPGGQPQPRHQVKLSGRGHTSATGPEAKGKRQRKNSETRSQRERKLSGRQTGGG